MREKYYLDTSIWLDFFENRNEINLPKGDFAAELINRIVIGGSRIVYSDALLDELMDLGYIEQEIDVFHEPLKKILVFVESTKKQYGKAKDLSAKRNLPLFDALHALIARDNQCVMVTRDAHFKKLIDITKPKKPEDII